MTNSPMSGAHGGGSTTITSGSSASVSDKSSSLDDEEILESFAGDVEEEKVVFMEGACYLKTKTDRFK